MTTQANSTAPMRRCQVCGQRIRMAVAHNRAPTACEPDEVEVFLPSGIVVRGLIPHWPYCPGKETKR